MSLLPFQVNVFFLDESKTGLAVVRSCVEKMKLGNVTNGILVLQKALSGPARTEVSQSKKYHLEVFQVAPLCIPASLPPTRMAIFRPSLSLQGPIDEV